MTRCSFSLPDGSTREVAVTQLFNAGYAGRDQEGVAAHIAELAELGVPAPSTTPTMCAVAPYLAQQTDAVQVQHGQTSGEAEWAMILTESYPETGEVLLAAACDHTDRALEVHGVAWSKNAAPDVLSGGAWLLSDLDDHLEQIRIVGRVASGDGDWQTIQDGTVADLLLPSYWLGVLKERGLDLPGTVLISGTIPMDASVDQFADRWQVELVDETLGRSVACEYAVGVMAEPIG